MVNYFSNTYDIEILTNNINYVNNIKKHWM